MPHKTCVYSSCGSDSRREKTLKFARFVKPSFDGERAEEWISRVSREDFGVKSISKYTFICEKHFVPGTVDFDYRTNPGLLPFKEGNALTHYLKKKEQKRSKQIDFRDEHNYFSKEFVNKVTAVVKTYEKTEKTKANIPVLRGVPVASPEQINFSGN